MYAAFQWHDANRRPDDDLIEVETCSLNYMIKFYVLDYIVILLF